MNKYKKYLTILLVVIIATTIGYNYSRTINSEVISDNKSTNIVEISLECDSSIFYIDHIELLVRDKFLSRINRYLDLNIRSTITEVEKSIKNLINLIDVMENDTVLIANFTNQNECEELKIEAKERLSEQNIILEKLKADEIRRIALEKAASEASKYKSVVNPNGSSSSSDSNVSSTNSNNTSNESFVASMSIASKTTSVLMVKASGSSATISFHRKNNGLWSQVLSCTGSVGSRGITSNKVEGDKKTPAGTYSFGQAFGISGNPGTSRSWLKVNNNHYWVDDSNSAYYNKLVDVTQVTKDWTSAEHLISYSTPYKYAIAINYNTSGVPNKGSAIFLHCMPSSGTTAGCVAVSQANMVNILKLIQSDTLIHIY